MSLRQHLRNLDEDLYAKFQVVEGKAKSLAEYAHYGTVPMTTHGWSHISAVERNYDWLLSVSDIQGISGRESFVLLCATLFHDIFMIPKDPAFGTAARATHAINAPQKLLELREELDFSVGEAEAIGEVIRAHAVDDFLTIRERHVLGNDRIDLRKLGACLSLADILHADNSRAPQIVYRYLTMEPESRFHWRRHLQISGITREDNTIVMVATAFSDEGLEAIEAYRLEIENQLRIIRPYFDTLLSPIHRVVLEVNRLDSPLDQSLSFKADVPAILALLIEGVYQRKDVFVRELVQNALDACKLGAARTGMILSEDQGEIIFSYSVMNGFVNQIRIDDHGIGMDVHDVEDTILWIGKSFSKDKDLAYLLENANAGSLIARFGIGLLSCFMVSKSIRIRSQKRGRQAIEFELSGISEPIKFRRAKDTAEGSTVIVKLTESTTSKTNLGAALNHYFRNVTSVRMRFVEVTDSQLETLNRTEFLDVAQVAGRFVNTKNYLATDDAEIACELVGGGIRGVATQPREIEACLTASHDIDILSEGVYVSTEPSKDWFGNQYSYLTGFIDFQAGVLDLTAGRDGIVQNEKLEIGLSHVRQAVHKTVEKLVSDSSNPSLHRRSALILSRVFKDSSDDYQKRIIEELGQYCVISYPSETYIKLFDIVKSMDNPLQSRAVYLMPETGKYVSELSSFGGKQLWHKEDDFVELQGALLAQTREIVVRAAREDLDQGDIQEVQMLWSYFKNRKISVFDISRETLVESRLQTRPLPGVVWRAIGDDVKFIVVASLPERRSWLVGKEVWLNVANPSVNTLYKVLLSGSPSERMLLAARALIQSLRYDFEGSVKSLVSLMERRN